MLYSDWDLELNTITDPIKTEYSREGEGEIEGEK